MKRTLTLLFTAFLFVATLALMPGCGGGGDSGGLSVTRSMLVGTWVLSTLDGKPCTGCIVLILNADGTGSGADTYGYGTGRPGTYKITWEFVGGKLYLRAMGLYDQTTVEMPSINVLHLLGGSNTNVYVRSQ